MQRRERAERIAAVLARKGYRYPAGARALAGREAVVGRIYALSESTGAVRSVDEAFQKYLGNGKAGDVKQMWPELEEAIAWILAAGGTPVLAHPAKYDLTRTRLRALLDDFIAAGGRAMEVSSGQQPPTLTRDLAALCNERSLWASVGSDFHQPGQSWAMLGRYSPLPDSCEPVWRHW